MSLLSAHVALEMLEGLERKQGTLFPDEPEVEGNQK
jgi:hypothetical protein